MGAAEPIAQPAQEMPQEPGGEGEMPPQETQGPAPEIQELMQGQEHLAQLMEMLITTVQAERERVPVRDKKTGDILHVIDRIKPRAPAAQE